MSEQVESFPLSPQIQRRNIRLVIQDGLAIGLMSGAMSFVSVFVVRLGASPLWVSLLTSIPAVIRLLMAIPWSQFAARQKQPQRVFVIARLCSHSIYLLIALIPFVINAEWTARIVVVIWSLGALGGSLQSLMFSIVMGHAVPPSRRSFLMSRRWMFLGMSKIVSVTLISQLVERIPFPLGYQIAFGVNAILAFIAFNQAGRLQVAGVEHQIEPQGRPLGSRVKEALIEVWQAKSFVLYVAGRALRKLGISIVAGVIPIFWVNELGASDTWVGYFTTALSAATLVSYIPWTRIKRKIGTWRTLIIAVGGTTLYPTLLSLTHSPLAVLPVMIVHGLSFAGMNLAYFDTLLDVCPPGKKERFLAINVTTLNLSGFIGPPIGAALLTVLPIRWVLRCGTMVMLIGVIVFILASLRPRERVPIGRPS